MLDSLRPDGCRLFRPNHVCVAFAVVSALVMTPPPARAQQKPDAEKLYQQARQAMAEGKQDLALKLSGQAVSADSGFAPAWQLRGLLFADRRQHQDAIKAFSTAIELRSDDADTIDRRGSEYLLQSKFDKAIADFDQAIKLEPVRNRSHWKRGIACYYAKRYEEGAKQFALYQTYDDNDVENSVWRFLCMAKEESVDKAREELMPIENDRRVPLMEVFALFRGEVKASSVMNAVSKGKPGAEELKRREFYAHLYLGLYYDAIGRLAVAQKHLDKAVERKLSGYMWDIAKVHAEYIRSMKESQSKSVRTAQQACRKIDEAFLIETTCGDKDEHNA
ncbi:MAG: tetratricopeptide repeat protein [Pirellulales bacterium]|nr:tetratricopeptide repeat protein [Pirellulales bacterium]